MAGEPEGFEAYRLLLRRYEPQTTATTVTKLVELLSTQFAGDLLDCVTDFERRVAVWESEAGEQLSDLIKIGVVVNRFEKGNFRDHLLINTSATATAATVPVFTRTGVKRAAEDPPDDTGSRNPQHDDDTAMDEFCVLQEIPG